LLKRLYGFITVIVSTIKDIACKDAGDTGAFHSFQTIILKNGIIILRGAGCKPEWTILTKIGFSSLVDEPVKVHDGFRQQPESRVFPIHSSFSISPFRRKPESRGGAEIITPQNEMTPAGDREPVSY
jgi:hypothetical protein